MFFRERKCLFEGFKSLLIVSSRNVFDVIFSVKLIAFSLRSESAHPTKQPGVEFRRGEDLDS